MPDPVWRPQRMWLWRRFRDYLVYVGVAVTLIVGGIWLLDPQRTELAVNFVYWLPLLAQTIGVFPLVGRLHWPRHGRLRSVCLLTALMVARVVIFAVMPKPDRWYVGWLVLTVPAEAAVVGELLTRLGYTGRPGAKR